MKKNIVFNALFLTSLFMGCQITDESKSKNNIRQINEKESFDVFYKQFHRDSLFQISRIKFPLPGINSDEMTIEDTSYYWKKADWLMQHMIDTTLFSRKMSVSDNIVEEVIRSNDPGFFIKRDFKSIKGNWYLVLYEDVNL